ncbi:hypothetical protein L9F63_022875, partial [Diploptera punctata]
NSVQTKFQVHLHQASPFTLRRLEFVNKILDFSLSILANVLDPPHVLVFGRKFVC